MRRLPALFFVSILLGACAKPPELPQQEVMERAMLASQRLQSATFVLSAEGAYLDGSSGREIFPDIALNGAFRQGGDMLSADADASFEWDDEEGGGHSVHVLGALSALAQDELYLRLDAIDADPPLDENSALSQLAPLLGEWFLFPYASAGSERDADRITPDPQALKEQASLVTVTENHGFEHVSGRYAYRYSVKLDKEKFLKMFPPAEGEAVNDALFDAEGELWIDAENFYLRKAEWSVTRLPVLEGEFRGTFSLELTGHDLSVTVTSPENPVILDSEAFPFSGEMRTP